MGQFVRLNMERQYDAIFTGKSAGGTFRCLAGTLPEPLDPGGNCLLGLPPTGGAVFPLQNFSFRSGRRQAGGRQSPDDAPRFGGKGLSDPAVPSAAASGAGGGDAAERGAGDFFAVLCVVFPGSGQRDGARCRDSPCAAGGGRALRHGGNVHQFRGSQKPSAQSNPGAALAGCKPGGGHCDSSYGGAQAGSQARGNCRNLQRHCSAAGNHPKA